MYVESVENCILTSIFGGLRGVEIVENVLKHGWNFVDNFLSKLLKVLKTQKSCWNVENSVESVEKIKARRYASGLFDSAYNR